MGLLGRAFDRFIEHQDESLAREAGSWRAWLGSSLFVLAFLPALAYVPGARDYFGLRIVPALLGWIPAMLGGLALGAWAARAPVFTRGMWVLELFGCTLVQLFCACLITWSTGRGAAALSSLFIFAAAYHGHCLRVTLTEPFMVLGTIASTVIAAALDRGNDRLGLFVFAGVAAVFNELLLGANAKRWERARTRAEQLRHALNANVLDEQGREVKRLSDTLVDVMARSHDLNNTLMALKLSIDALGFEHERSRSDQVAQIHVDLEAGFARMQGLADGIKVAGMPESLPAAEIIDVVPVVDAALLSLGARFPSVKQSLAVDRAVSLRAPVRGGVLTLRRILENLFINACQGDGERGAGKISVRVLRDVSGSRLLIHVSDDGPGFTKDALDRPIQIFASTKAQGSGLGLFTCERLLRASGGQLERANLPEGGAQLTAILPLERG